MTLINCSTKAWHLIDTEKHPRTCGDCNVCCKLPPIPPTTFKNKPFKKSGFTWCKNCEIGIKCKVYDDRPITCKIFECSYLVGLTIQRPNKLGFLAIMEAENSVQDKIITIYCEPHRLSSLIKNLKKEHNFNLMIESGFRFVIKTNKDDDMLVYDPQLGETLTRPRKVEVKEIKDKFNREKIKVNLEF